MNKRIPFITAVLMVFALFTQMTSAEIIILNETKPSFYAVEDMTLSGDLNNNILDLSGSGQVIAGEDVKVYLLGRAEDILVDGLTVDGSPAPVSFDEKGYFMVLDKGKFSFDGTVSIRTRGQVKIYVPGPVNALNVKVENGYAIHGDQYGLFDREVIIQRSQKAAMMVDGGFKYTYADRNTFQYQLSYRSFGSSLGQAVVNLRNGESILSVTGANDYSVEGGKLMLELEGEEANVYITGTFNSQTLRIPLDEGKHNVLIESDPEKKITISTDAEEIDLSQSSMSPSYSNARAFLAAYGNSFSITLEELKKYPSLAASVSKAVNSIAITEKGSMLAELNYRYSNTGYDYIKLDAPGTPLYAATGYRNSVKLTKENDSLYLSFPKTSSGTLDVIYFDTRDPIKAVDLIDVPVANTDLPITEAETRVILPEDYVVLWTYGAKGGSELPSAESAIVFLVIFGGIGYMMREKTGFTLLYTVYSAGLYYFSPVILLVSMMASILLIVKKHISEKSLKWMLAGAAVMIVLCLGAVAFFAVAGSFMSAGSTYYDNTAMLSSDYARVDEAAAPMLMTKSMEVMGAGDGAMNVPVREGVLPVRLELPALGKTITVKSHLIHEDNPLKISVLVVAGWLRYVLYFVSLAAGLTCLSALKK